MLMRMTKVIDDWCTKQGEERLYCNHDNHCKLYDQCHAFIKALDTFYYAIKEENRNENNSTKS
jgi:hypothetical protein